MLWQVTKHASPNQWEPRAHLTGQSSWHSELMVNMSGQSFCMASFTDQQSHHAIQSNTDSAKSLSVSFLGVISIWTVPLCAKGRPKGTALGRGELLSLALKSKIPLLGVQGGTTHQAEQRSPLS